MRRSDWLNGSSETDNDERDLKKFELEQNDRATVIKGRLALGVLFAGAFTLLKDVLVTVNSYAAPLFPKEKSKVNDSFSRAKVDEFDNTDQDAANVARSPYNGQSRDSSSDPGSGGGANGSHLTGADIPADFQPFGSTNLNAVPLAGLSDNVVEFPTATADPAGATGAQPESGGASGGSGGSGGSVAPIPPAAGNDNDFDFPDSGESDTDVGDVVGLPATDIDVGMVNDEIADPFDTDPEEEDGSEQIRNRAPIVGNPVRLDGLLVNQSVIIGLTSFLAHASDPDGDTLSIRNLTVSSGDLANNGDGTWTFTPASDDVSDVVFSYSVSDGEVGTAQTALMDLLPSGPNIIVGTEEEDDLVGTQGEDLIHAKAGHDIVIAGDGNDTIFGGEGDDTIEGGAGDDLILAGGGDDVVFAGDGDDRVFAGTGNDTVFGGAGDDILFGEEGDDSLYGEAGNDTIYGDDGHDEIDGGAGDDEIDGGDGDDLIVATKLDGNDHYDGGGGVDTYDLSGTDAAAVVDLGAGTATSVDTGADRLENIENVIGSTAGDDITGDDEDNHLSGGDGDDEIDGGDGDDIIFGGHGPGQAVSVDEQEHHADHSHNNHGHDNNDDDDDDDDQETETATLAQPEQETAGQTDGGNTAVKQNTDETAAREASDDNEDATKDLVVTASVDETADAEPHNNPAGGSSNATEATDEETSGWANADDATPGQATTNENETAANVVALSNRDGDDSDSDSDDDDDDDSDSDDDHHDDGDDVIKGGRGDDIIEGGRGHDVIDGEEDDDRFYASDDDGDDDYIGGEGSDTYDLSRTEARAWVNLRDGTATSDDTGHDTLHSVENVVGTSNDDEIVASAARNILTGNGGDDVFIFEDVEDMGVGDNNRDFITDFNIGDTIDISEINAHSDDDEDDDEQSFELLHNAGQELEVGQISYRHVYFEEEKRTIIEGNVEGGADVDFELELAGHIDLTKDHFDGVG